MSPRRKWYSPNPSLASECAPPPRAGGRGAHSVRGWGSPNSDDWRKSLAFCLLCGTACRVPLWGALLNRRFLGQLLRQLPLTVPQKGGDVFIPLKSDWPYSMRPSAILVNLFSSQVQRMFRALRTSRAPRTPERHTDKKRKYNFLIDKEICTEGCSHI